jgi:ABC-type multidrug transport system fused ATPase/permease subunit
MDRGKIAEEGNFDELMEKKGLFYEFAQRQVS